MSEKNTFKKPKGYKIMAKKSAENSPSTTQNQGNSQADPSGKPPKKAKNKGVGHTKNSMSTHVKKKDNYFYTQEDEFQEDIDEFPSDMGNMKPQNRKTEYDQQIEDDSSLLKYKEYKRMYFEEAKLK